MNDVKPLTKLILAVICLSLWPLAAETGNSVWTGIYTPEQAQRGRKVYADICADCHMRALTGDGESQPLAGDCFLNHWEGETVGTLFDRVRVTMPFIKPGTLSRQQVADVVAFVLYFNNFPSGKTELGTRAEALQQIRITAAHPH